MKNNERFSTILTKHLEWFIFITRTMQFSGRYIRLNISEIIINLFDPTLTKNPKVCRVKQIFN